MFIPLQTPSPHPPVPLPYPAFSYASVPRPPALLGEFIGRHPPVPPSPCLIEHFLMQASLRLPVLSGHSLLQVFPSFQCVHTYFHSFQCIRAHFSSLALVSTCSHSSMQIPTSTGPVAAVAGARRSRSSFVLVFTRFYSFILIHICSYLHRFNLRHTHLSSLV